MSTSEANKRTIEKWVSMLETLESEVQTGSEERVEELSARLAEVWCLDLAPLLSEKQFLQLSLRWRRVLETERELPDVP